jgi:hypothetical protein
MGTIVGVAVGAVGVVGLTAFLVIFLLRRRNSGKPRGMVSLVTNNVYIPYSFILYTI